MSRTAPQLLAGALILAVAACSTDRATGPTADAAQLAGAFATAPVGSDVAVNSYVGSAGAFGWMPRADHFGGGFMGGGLAGLFMGHGFGVGFLRGPSGDEDHLPQACEHHGRFGRMECAPTTVNNLTVNRSVTYTDASGAEQTSFVPGVTDMIDVQVSVSGTITRPSGTTKTVDLASDRSVAGLSTGSTARTINGTSASHETIEGTDTIGAWTATRVAGDTTDNVVIPTPTTFGPPIPASGTIVRSMVATFAHEGETPATTSRRELITYDGTDTATVVITQDGVTKTCTLPLPFGRLTCP